MKIVGYCYRFSGERRYTYIVAHSTMQSTEYDVHIRRNCLSIILNDVENTTCARLIDPKMKSRPNERLRGCPISQ